MTGVFSSLMGNLLMECWPDGTPSASHECMDFIGLLKVGGCNCET